MTSLIFINFVMFYLLSLRIKLLGILLIFSTLQNPYFRQFTSGSFVASMEAPPFEGPHFKKWRVRAVL
jgi:hypothetical protein